MSTSSVSYEFEDAVLTPVTLPQSPPTPPTPPDLEIQDVGDADLTPPPSPPTARRRSVLAEDELVRTMTAFLLGLDRDAAHINHSARGRTP